MSPCPIEKSVQAAHAELWRRFVHPERFAILDFTDLEGKVSLPTAEESRRGKPNGLAWGCPNEDGPMFGGLYLDAAIGRWQITGDDEDRQKARRIASGLMTLASVGKRKGFVARGLCDDGSSHHPIGSNDQTSPWIYGLWRYAESNVPEDAERRRVIGKLTEVAEVLRNTGWRMPCDREPFDYRGSFAHFNWEGAPRLLFLCKMMARLTSDEDWRRLYQAALEEKNPSGGPDRLAVCARGMVFDYEPRHSWTAAPGVASLRALWEMETEPALKAAYLQGLRASADLAGRSLPLALQFDNNDTSFFDLDWRILNETWHEQTSVKDAVELATSQMHRLGRLSPRRVLESQRVREPLFAAWVVTLCPDEAVLAQHAPAVMKAIRHYDYSRLYMSQFFPAESAYCRLRQSGVGVP